MIEISISRISATAIDCSHPFALGRMGNIPNCQASYQLVVYFFSCPAWLQVLQYLPSLPQFADLAPLLSIWFPISPLVPSFSQGTQMVNLLTWTRVFLIFRPLTHLRLIVVVAIRIYLLYNHNGTTTFPSWLPKLFPTRGLTHATNRRSFASLLTDYWDWVTFWSVQDAYSLYGLIVLIQFIPFLSVWHCHYRVLPCLRATPPSRWSTRATSGSNCSMGGTLPRNTNSRVWSTPQPTNFLLSG